MLPGELLRSLYDLKGFDEQSFVDVHNSGKQVVSIRFNPFKLKKSPADIFAGSEKIPWSSYGYYLPSRPSFTLDPFLHAGVYYVQEASSMFIEQCVRQPADLSKSIKVLDLCAAPGGKSTLLQSVISSNSLLVSNEVIKTRVNVLSENLTKWGAGNVIVTNNDPSDFSRVENYFDLIVVDAPCSGSGLFRRDADAISEWSTDAVKLCSLRQQRILADAYSCLKTDGMLIYSTCSYSKEENEDICDWLMQDFGFENMPLLVPPEWNIIETTSDSHGAKGYRFFPDKVRGEGFFVSCFRKRGGENVSSLPKKRKLNMVSNADAAVISPWIKNIGGYDLYELGGDVFCFPKSLNEDLLVLHSNLYIKKAGVKLGKIIRKELVPDHELAVSQIVNSDLPSISLKKEDALQYLRKEEVTIDYNSKGWSLVKYENENLGWMKLLGNRSNNYYPKEWRILKSGKN